MVSRRALALLSLMILTPSVFSASAPKNLIDNPSFSRGTQGWEPLWVREEGKGEETVADGALRVTYGGERDWSVGQTARVPVRPGEVYAFSGKVKVLEGTGAAQLSVVTRDEKNAVLDWAYGMRQTWDPGDWKTLEGRFVVPTACSNVQFRLTGWGKGAFLFDDLSLTKVKDAPQGVTLSGPVSAVSASLTLTLDPGPKTLRLSVVSGATYDFDFSNLFSSLVAVRTPTDDRIELSLVNPSGTDVTAILAAGPQYATLSLKGDGPLDNDFAFPGPLTSHPGQSWVLPVNEGLLIPCDDPAFDTWDLQLYCGHGLCMPFVGLTDGRQGLLAVAETQDDAAVHFTAPTGEATSRFSFLWQPSRKAWGYERVLRLMPVTGGYVPLAKAYRAYAKEKGLLVTLREKAKTVPQVDKLIGAVNLWYWADAPSWRQDDDGAAAFGKALKDNGIDRVLWSHEQKSADVDALNALGFLTGRYDIYQDVWGPDDPHAWVNRDGWPDDLVLLPDGTPMRGWVDKDASGKEYPGGVICSERALLWEQRKVPPDLASHAYGARFLDTTTATPMRECYDPKHPLSRSDDRRNKMALLDYLSVEQRLVTGSETGVDMAVPHLHYFEGMMSLGPYRLPDSGYDLTSAKQPTDDFKRFQLGPRYRIPLFELVYHDCVADSWYWGDSSNRVPEMWDERDMFNALYGTMPLWIVDPKIWEEHKDRFVQSYRNATRVARATGYSEMTEHLFLTADHTAQETVFSDGTKVWANFGAAPYQVHKGVKLAPRSFRAEFPDGKVLMP